LDTVLFLGNSSAQLRALPPEIRQAFDWAIDWLEKNPSRPPQDSRRSIETKQLTGPVPLFRISVRPKLDDPGYRGVYHFDGTRVLFVRFAHRDAQTYKGLRRLHRLIADRPDH
jgi:mRNA-degrading endonuclease RelE of RelBE toxin-antitoxin system